MCNCLNIKYCFDCRGTRILVLDFNSFAKEFHRACAMTGYLREEIKNYFFCSENHHLQFIVMLPFTRHILFKHVCIGKDEKYNISAV